jgi:hypothetical protein
MNGYVLARRYVGSADDHHMPRPRNEYSAVDMFDGDDSYSEADKARRELQKRNSDYAYEIFTKRDWFTT